MSTNKVYFITGASRGIGFAMTTILAADPSNIIIGSARDPAKATALNKLAEKGNVFPVKLDISSEESIAGLDAQLSKVAADGIDYYINNAAIAIEGVMEPSMEVKKELWTAHLNANAIGAVLVSQVVKPYLSKRDTRVMFYISSLAGSLGAFFEFSSSAYGMSKAALNHFVKTLAYELKDEGFIVVSSHPGVVSTDMGKDGARWATPEIAVAFENMSITPEESASKQLDVISKLTKEDSSKFLSYTGEEVPW